MVISTLCVGAEMPLKASFALSTSYCGLWWTAPGSKYVRAMQQIRMFLPAATSVFGKAGFKTGSITAPSHLALIRVTRDITV